MLNDKESPFTLTLLDGGLCLPVLRFSGHEALNQLYRFEIEVIGLAPAQPPGSLLHQAAFLQLDNDQGIHGIIQSVSCEHRGTHRIGYQLVLMPHLSALDLQPRRRVFTRSDVPAIIQQLLTEHCLAPHSYRIEMNVGHYPPRPFCIQYDESDLALLQRLCEEEGIHYHFEHQPDGHVVVFADDSLSLPQQPTSIGFSNENDAPSPTVSALFQRHKAVIPMLAQSFRERGQVQSQEEAANHSVPANEPGLVPSEQRHAEQRSRRQLERQRCEYRSIHGRSDCPRLRSGQLLQVADHPLSGFNEQWLITELRHQGQQPSILEPMPATRGYHNEFTAQPWSTDFRPPLRHARPSIPGYQLARVRGTPGQPPQPDDQGRIAVQLWPALGETENLWLPIATSGRLAADALPRAGSEVWVSFLDSDPDRPILCLDACGSRPLRQTMPEPDTDDPLLNWLLNRAAP
ncbi:type VI secretion system Vgr family protein [Pseudomonas sp. TWP3-2]|uniref:type VI secretion system Vgr family protein n=1 Tax=Pseudomonas sp. TWP3-2 TaxID=2804574 RepID=UPI003CEE2CA9